MTPKRFPPLCLGCNYPLEGLLGPRCPECGREFDLNNFRTFNWDRPLTWLDRKLLAPIGAPTFAAVALACLGFLYLALSSYIYYMLIQFFLAIVLCAFVILLLAVRLGLRKWVPPPSIARPSNRKRVRLIFVTVIITCVLVFAHVPMLLAFWLSRPALDRLVSDIQSEKVKLPLSSRRAGPFVLSSSPWYGGDDSLFFEYLILGIDGGIAYCPTNGPLGYYNDGTYGHLGGHWYWWVDD